MEQTPLASDTQVFKSHKPMKIDPNLFTEPIASNVRLPRPMIDYQHIMW